MLIRDRFGYLRDIPEQRFGRWSNSGLGEVVYDGLGNPVGAFPFLAALAPLAAKILPMAANLLPMLAPSRPSSPPPASPPAPALLPPSSYEPIRSAATPAPPQIIVVREPPSPGAPFPPPSSLGPGQMRPLVVFRRRGLRRRRPRVRVKVERTTEQVSLPPPPALSPPPVASESSGGVNGWYPSARFGGYF
jgi:hypothetical protein